MLMVSELSEAMEGARKGVMDDHLPHRKMEEVEMADCLVRLLDFAGGMKAEFDRTWTDICKTPDSIDLGASQVPEDPGEALLEIVDSLVRLSACYYTSDPMGVSEILTEVYEKTELYCGARGLDLWSAYEEKMAYNAQRADHKPENRRKEGGKKW